MRPSPAVFAFLIGSRGMTLWGWCSSLLLQDRRPSSPALFAGDGNPVVIVMTIIKCHRVNGFLALCDKSAGEGCWSRLHSAAILRSRADSLC